MSKYDDMSFGKAFAAARKEKGAGKTFTWKGNSYTTDYKEEKSSKPSPAPTPRPTAEKPMSSGPSSRPRRPAAEVAAAKRSVRSAMSQVEKTMDSGPSGRPTTNRDEKLRTALEKADRLQSQEVPDDPKTYIDNLNRIAERLRALISDGGLSERKDKFRGLRADGPMFEGRSGTTGSRSRAGMAKGGMVKKGYAKGGMANCGASVKPNRKAKK